MKKLDQAIFGYSSGHRLLASSMQLSNSSIKVLEILSDLSGNDTSSEFNGYYTGCWLPDDNCYAISKTWYATEMPRPGCAWTHTLLLSMDQYSISLDVSLEEVFKRPNINLINWKDFYKNPVKFDNDTQQIDLKNIPRALWLMNVIVCEKESIAICYNNSNLFNHLFEILFSIMGVLFFRGFYFCTSSQSNRLIKEMPLNVQIMPLNVSKVVLRTLNTISAFDPKVCEVKETDIQNFDVLLKIRDFMLLFGEKYYSYKYFKDFADTYTIIHEDNNFELKKYITTMQKSFERQETIEILEILIRTLYENSDNDDMAINKICDILYSLITLDGELDWLSDSLNINIFDDILHELYIKMPKKIIFLITKSLLSELSNFGENMIKYLSFIIGSCDFAELINNNVTVSIVLLQQNWKLALNKDLWLHSLGLQCEMLKYISISFRNGTEIDDDFVVLLEIIYSYSNQDICEQLYSVFGDFAIKVYFSWNEKTNRVYETKWIAICKYAPRQSIVLLRSLPTSNPSLFKAILNIFDPWNSYVNSIPVEIWESLYVEYCKEKNDNLLNDCYAKFMLQIIINTNSRLSEKFAYFIFIRVHRLLESNDFDILFWNRISPFLPEIQWYNSWDKCKRLRKFAKKLGYQYIFS